jgi:hypothetical protein
VPEVIELCKSRACLNVFGIHSRKDVLRTRGLVEGYPSSATVIHVLGPAPDFIRSGRQTLRVQTREDGLTTDQITLSAATYLNTAPSATTRDL